MCIQLDQMPQLFGKIEDKLHFHQLIYYTGKGQQHEVLQSIFDHCQSVFKVHQFWRIFSPPSSAGSKHQTFYSPFQCLSLYFFFPPHRIIKLMGACGCFRGNTQRPPRQKPSHGKIDIHCPICEEDYNTDDRKPYVICGNKHKLCHACLSSMKNHASLKRSPLLCPFCKVPIQEDMVTTDSGIYNFLDAELETLKRLPQEKRKLFAFSSIYLPKLHEFMKEEAKGNGGGVIHDKIGSKRDLKPRTTIDSIQLLSIKGRMLEEYEVFEMEMLDCLTNLRKIYLNNNHIKAIDTTGFSPTKIILIDISHNKISSLSNILSDSSKFVCLKVLMARNNLIQEMPGINNLPNLQVVNLKNNKLQSLSWFTGCKELRHLDVEFNKITSTEFPANLTQLYSLLMFGNSVNLECWENFAKLSWKDLRLLTATVGKASLLEKFNIHNRMVKLTAPYLKLLVFEMGIQQPETEVAQILSPDTLDSVQKLQLNAQSYAFYTENESLLKENMNSVIRSHPFGRNVNFKPAQLNKKVYQEDEKFSTYKKVSNSQDPADFLETIPISKQAKGTLFVSFIAKSTKLLIGVRQKASAVNKIEVNLDNEMVTIGQEEFPCKPFKLSLKDKQEFQVCIGISMQQGNVSFMVGSIVLDNYYFTNLWQNYHFYVHLVEMEQSIKIIRDEIDLI